MGGMQPWHWAAAMICCGAVAIAVIVGLVVAFSRKKPGTP